METNTLKYQKYVACSYDYKLPCVDHQLSLSNHMERKMPFTILLAVWLKKRNIVVMMIAMKMMFYKRSLSYHGKL